MARNQTERTYLVAAVQNATAAGLVVILFDLLIDDLRRVIAAIETGDIEKRCAELRHAFLVLQQLEGSLDLEKGGEAAKKLSMFYSVVRPKLLEAHTKASPEIFERQIELLFEVRQAWQQVDQPNLGMKPGPLPVAAGSVPQFSDVSDQERTTTSWTA